MSTEMEPDLPAIPSLDSSDPSAPLLTPAYQPPAGQPPAGQPPPQPSAQAGSPNPSNTPIAFSSNTLSSAPETKSPSPTEASPYMASGSSGNTSSSAAFPPRSSIKTTYSSVQPSASAVLRSQGGSSLPLISGPPPVVESETCRTCGKKFIPLIRRCHTCQHCGYPYCSDHCADSALMPRRAIRAHRAYGQNSGNNNKTDGSSMPFGFGGSGSGAGGGSGFGQTLRDAADEIFGSGPSSGNEQGGGFEAVEICGQCAPNVQVTSGSTPYLRSLPLKRLQAYCKAYNLNTANNIEKEDFVQSILRAKGKETGCLSPEAESYYRRHSVPKQGVLPPAPVKKTTPPVSGPSSRASPSPGTSRQQARPPLVVPRSPPSRPSAPTTYGHPPYRPAPQQNYPRPAQPTPHRAAPPPAARQAPRPIPPKPKATPPPPVPTIQSLVPLPASYISSLSIGTLKAILYENHVKVDYSQVLEKGELARRVTELCKEEKKRLERQAQQEAAEEEAASQGRTLQDQLNAANGRKSDSTDEEMLEADEQVHVPDQEVPNQPKAGPTGPQAVPERDGVCVICQDEDAQLAVVDCGHLCMCTQCSKLVMATSRECPLCRTRIVTEQRLIRIFRT